ncbi:MAG: class I SAM-dependent methyltransferase [Coleofasciculaceae cyanobacterium SM2_3_26]|nr:class I SAM-dependent methyltransferase [Coleofasciculaceae cyanobacterium SM2_3_26]
MSVEALFDDNLPTKMGAVAQRFDREYRGQHPELPEEVQEMPIFQEWVTGTLAAKVASPFWEIAAPKKNQRCLDLGCGVGFLVYPWREWDAFFYGQEISTVAKDALNARAPQLNSKLFKGVKASPAHLIEYEELKFDLAIATGFSCYFEVDYWRRVLDAVKKSLKPDGFFVFDVLDPDAPLAEDWAILETYLGAEALVQPLSDWKAAIRAEGGNIVKEKSGELFHLYKVKF